jgi:hypothetical protein
MRSAIKRLPYCEAISRLITQVTTYVTGSTISAINVYDIGLHRVAAPCNQTKTDRVTLLPPRPDPRYLRGIVFRSRLLRWNPTCCSTRLGP